MSAVILASTSTYRRELLARLHIPFDCLAPQLDETPLPNETAHQTAVRLAKLKAGTVAAAKPQALVIGADQTLELDRQTLGKPHTFANAVRQLQQLSGRRAVFHCAVAVYRQADNFTAAHCEEVTVTMRSLSQEEINNYLRIEQPFDCAGSAKCEGLGISLMTAIDSHDPTALIGLPLITTARLLRAGGISWLNFLDQN